MGPCSNGIEVTNLQNGEVLCYSLVLIRGRIDRKDRNADKLMLHHYNENGTLISSTSWPIVRDKFHCLLNLKLDRNFLILEHCGLQLKLVLDYQPRRTNLRVTPVYIICQGHDGLFQAPESEDNTVPSACARIALGARIIQSLVAEKLFEATNNRVTFQLEQDLNRSSPPCIVFRSQLPVERARVMAPRELWEHFGRELMLSPLGCRDRKFLGFLSCTRYQTPADIPRTHEEMIAATAAYVALGGGGLALFGSACLHTWPLNVEEVFTRFQDNTKVDCKKFLDDSCYRGTYGGCFATTLGSACHELGHAFDLGHTPSGIMGRGFDDVDRVFILSDEQISLEDGNRNISSPVYKELPQHSTISLTPVLNVSYTVSSPIKRPRSKSHSGSTRPNSSTTEGIKRSTLNLDEPCCKKLQKQSNNNMNQSPCGSTKSLSKDYIHWSRSCAALLLYHRWFVEEVKMQETTPKLSFDDLRKTVISGAGIRVVEIRDNTGLVLSSWDFLEGNGVKEFVIPTDALSEPSLTLVAEDSNGNIIKHKFP